MENKAEEICKLTLIPNFRLDCYIFSEPISVWRPSSTPPKSTFGETGSGSKPHSDPTPQIFIF